MALRQLVALSRLPSQLSVSGALPHKYIPKVTVDCKSVAADQALKPATDLVDMGERNWKRTNVTILDRTKH
jgi:hypothetical protein